MMGIYCNITHSLIFSVRNWTYALFYVLANMWGSVVVSLLFWGFANEVNSTLESVFRHIKISYEIDYDSRWSQEILSIIWFNGQCSTYFQVSLWDISPRNTTSWPRKPCSTYLLTYYLFTYTHLSLRKCCPCLGSYLSFSLEFTDNFVIF